MPGSSCGPDDLLARHQTERNALLARITALVEADERIVAAWLYGSLGRGDSDEWSDIDIWLVVADDHLASIAGSRHAYVAQPENPLLVVDAPQNAPPGGAFLSVVYPGQAGPQHVDWTWQPQSTAALPASTGLLFDRAGIPSAPVAPIDTAGGRLREASKQLAFFWMMVPIVAKSIARRQPWVAINLLVILVRTSDQLKSLVGKQNEPPRYPSRATPPPPTAPADQLDFLSTMAGEVELLAASVEGLSEAVSEEARRQIKQTISLARTLPA